MCCAAVVVCPIHSGTGWVHSFLCMLLTRDLIGSAVSDVIEMGVCVGEGLRGHG